MSWTFENFPAELKDLSMQVRKKAIELINQLLEQGYTEEKALKEAMKKAEEWAMDEEG